MPPAHADIEGSWQPPTGMCRNMRKLLRPSLAMKVVSIQFPWPGGSREMSKRICKTGFLTRLLVMCSLRIGMSAIRSSPMALSHINLFSSLGDLDFQLSGSSEVFNLTLCISEENVSTRCLEVPWSNQNGVAHFYPYTPFHLSPDPTDSFYSISAFDQDSIVTK